MLRVLRMLRMLRMFWMFWMVGVRRMLRPLPPGWVWPLPVALPQSWGASQRVLFHLHEPMLAIRASTARSPDRVLPLIRVAIQCPLNLGLLQAQRRRIEKWRYDSVARTLTAPVGKRTQSCVLPRPLSRTNSRARLPPGAAGVVISAISTNWLMNVLPLK